MTSTLLQLKQSVPLESNDLEQGLEYIMIDVNSFKKSIKNNREVINYFNGEKHNSKK